jgi:hypothetical protein
LQVLEALEQILVDESSTSNKEPSKRASRLLKDFFFKHSDKDKQKQSEVKEMDERLLDQAIQEELSRLDREYRSPSVGESSSGRNSVGSNNAERPRRKSVTKATTGPLFANRSSKDESVPKK